MAERALELTLLSLLKAMSWSYYALPRRLRVAAGAVLGGLIRLTGSRAKVVRENLDYAFPGADEATTRRKAALFREAYRHLGNLVLDIVLLLGPMRRHVERAGTAKGLEHWEAAHRQGKGVLFLSSHVGNWEIMAAIGGVKGGIDLMLVTKHLKPEWLHRAIERARARCGVSATYEPRTLRDVLRALKAGRTVGFVLDQYTGPPVGVRVPVFGRPVGTSTALATLARRTGAPVLPVVNYRTADGRQVGEIFPALEWIPDEDPKRELALNTARYASVLESHIRAYPEQWLWTHRRFKGSLAPLVEGEWSEGRARR